MSIRNRKKDNKNRKNRGVKSFSLFSSKNIFLFFTLIFLIFVSLRFWTIKSIEINSNENYLYQFSGDIYKEFYIENNQTIEMVQQKDKTVKKVLTPYSFVELNLDKKEEKKAVYQLIPDKKEHTISLFTRTKWFEVIGGEFSSDEGDSIIRLKKGDKPTLMILNHDMDSNLYRAKKLRVVALRAGYYYQSLNNERLEIPLYKGSLKRVRDREVWNSLDGIEIDDRGYITNGKDIIKIALGSKNKSVLISTKPKKYSLTKANTIEVSVVDKNTPSSILELVSQKGLQEKKLSYDYIRIAHLLIKNNISNAKSIIDKYVDSDNFLKKELTDIVENIDSEYLEKFSKKRDKLSSIEREKLEKELLRYVIEGDYYRVKKLIMMGADVNVLSNDGVDLLSFVLTQQKYYITVPQKMKFVDDKLIIRGNERAFKYKITSNSYFPIDVPILDKPMTPRKENLRVDKLNEFLDVTHMNGLWVSDKNAEVFYSKDRNSFIQKAIVNYKKTPPLFLYDGEIGGKFVAPPINIKGKFYYKIKTNKKRVTVAFNGTIKVNRNLISKNYNSIVPFKNRDAIDTRGGEVILEVDMVDRPLPCGVVFESDERIESLRYSYTYNKRDFKKFKITDNGSRYIYRLQSDSSKPFKKYSLKVKADANYRVNYLGDNQFYGVGRKIKNFKYSPSMSCLEKEDKKEFLSLYDQDNMLEIVPKDYKKSGLRAKEKKAEIIGDIDEEDNITVDILSKELLPIYGDGIRFGLTSKDVTAEELTLDARFSKKVADIFEEVINPLKSKKEKKKRKDYNTILEGAVVVLKDSGENDLSVVAMYSYPYPRSLNIKNKESYNQEIFRYILLDEFNNARSSIRNRALDMRIRPGSTFKIVTAITGFKEGMIPLLDSKYKKNIEGKQDINNTKFRNKSKIDMKLKNFSFSTGYTEPTKGATFKNSFKYSYNVYFGYLSLLLNHKLDKGFKKELYPISKDKSEREKEFPLLRVANELQFNQAIYLSKEKKIFAYPSLFPNNFVLAKEVADAGIGQFEVAVTPMQMAIVANSIRSGAVVIPKILKEEESQVIDAKFLTPKIQKEIQEAMGLVVSDREGTAKCAFYHKKFADEARRYNKRVKKKKRIRIPCYKYSLTFKGVNPNSFDDSEIKVYGKTGTAEKGKGNLYDGWFIAYTKSKKGDIVVATVVRNSGTGGTYSATITKKVIEAWYNKNKERGE